MNMELAQRSAELLESRSFEEAKQVLLSMEPGPSGVVENFLGQCEYGLENYTDALQWLHKAIQKDPSQFEVYIICGHIHHYNLEYSKAIELYKQAYQFAPAEHHRSIEGQINYSKFKVDRRTLDFYDHITDQIATLDSKHINKVNNPKSILVKLVQGIGEEILAIPFLHKACKKYESVTVMCSKKLVDVLQDHLPQCNVISSETRLPETDARLTSFDLMNSNNIDLPDSWMQPNPLLAKSFRDKFDDRPVVGVVWSSPNTQLDYKKKSIPVTHLEVLREYSNKYNFVSLQYGSESPPDFIQTIDNIDLYNDIPSLVALTSICDKVVGGSNSVQCIAGALGICAYNMVHSGSGMAWIWNYTIDQQSLLFPSVTVIETPNGKSDWEFCFHELRKYL